MATAGKQVRNGKAFEYAIAQEYHDFLKKRGGNVQLSEDSAFLIGKAYFDHFAPLEQERFRAAAKATIDTIDCRV